MAETFAAMRAHVHPLFWPLLWVNLALVWARVAQLEAYVELRVCWYGGVRIARIFPDPAPDWRDDILAAEPRLSVAGVRLILLPAGVSIRRMGAAARAARSRLHDSYCPSPVTLDSS
ncbi:MAG: hypothetical protein AAFY43_05980 [Pseudomonadota bacterium]